MRDRFNQSQNHHQWPPMELYQQIDALIQQSSSNNPNHGGPNEATAL